MLSFILLWNYMNIEMGYHLWMDISSGIVGPRSWTKLHLSEIFGVFGLGILLCLIGGKEVITIDPVRFRIRKDILGAGWYRNFQLVDVKDIRAGSFLDPKANGKWNPDHVRAGMYFDCQGKIYSFGKALTTMDAQRIEDAIRKACPRIVINRG